MVDTPKGAVATVPPLDLFVGRGAELAALRAGLDDALRRRGRLYLVTGDPGIGKTRLADEVTRAAADAGVSVLWGRCWEERGAPAYWPWIQIIRDCLHDDGPELTLRRMGSGAWHLSQIVPELREALAGAPPAPASDAALSRFQLFDALTSFLMVTSRERPLVLVLDDLHAADVPSLLLLEFVARALRRLRVLIYGAYREPEVQAHDEVAGLIAGIAREGATLRLGGLDREEVGALLKRMSSGPVPANLARTVHQVTEGNPLFVWELARLLATQREELREGVDPAIALPTPDTVRHTIRRRVALLSNQALAAVSVAAVLGREFTARLLQSVADVDAESLPALLDEATRVGVVAPTSPSADRYGFTHGLIRDVLYQELPPRRRFELHLQVGQRLEEHYADQLDLHVAEVAHHFCQAAAGGGADQASRYAVRAAEQAAGQFAWEEAAEWYRRALAALDLQDDPQEGERCDLLLALGRALGRAGRSESSRETFLNVYTLARSLDSPEQLAHAALGYGWLAMTTGVADAVLIRMLEEALTALGDTDSALRVDVMTRLVLELAYTDEPALVERRGVLAREATAVARTLGEPMPLIYAIEAAAWAGAGPDSLVERLDAGDEIIRLAQEHDEGMSGAAEMGHLIRLPVFLEMGDVAAAERELRSYERVAETLKEPDLIWYATVAEGAFALLEGRFQRAERLAHRALEIGEPARAEEARQYFGLQLLNLLRQRGDTGLLSARIPEFEDLAMRFPTLPALRAAVACAYADVGRLPAARATLERLLAIDIEDRERNTTWLVLMAHLAELCAVIGDSDRAARLHPLLAPYATHQVVFEAAVVCLGSASRYLGLLAATMGDLQQAVGHYEHALTANARVGARPYLAHAQHEYAELLLARNTAGDHEQARILLAEAVEAARDLGMTGLEYKASALLESVDAAAADQSAAVPAPAATPSRGLFRREGDYWSIVYGDARLTVRHAKGMGYLARLLACPGTEIHVLDLVAGAAGATRDAAAARRAQQEGLAVAANDAGPVLDAPAKAAYRKRVDDLREEFADAEAMNDPVRAAQAREELEFLIHELAASVGLGGRDRKAASAAERARVNVTRTIKQAVQNIRAQSPALGEHLAVSIKTGTFCCYRPDPRAELTWSP